MYLHDLPQDLAGIKVLYSVARIQMRINCQYRGGLYIIKYIQYGDPAIHKVGKSSAIPFRLQAYATHCPEEPELVKQYIFHPDLHATVDLEVRKRLVAHNTRREFFRCGLDLIDKTCREVLEESGVTPVDLDNLTVIAGAIPETFSHYLQNFSGGVQRILAVYHETTQSVLGNLERLIQIFHTVYINEDGTHDKWREVCEGDCEYCSWPIDESEGAIHEECHELVARQQRLWAFPSGKVYFNDDLHLLMLIRIIRVLQLYDDPEEILCNIDAVIACISEF